MTLDKFTIKAQEAVQEAVNTAQRNGQQTIEPVHLLAGVMNKAKDVVNFLLQKCQRRAAAAGTADGWPDGRPYSQGCRHHGEGAARSHPGFAPGPEGTVAVG